MKRPAVSNPKVVEYIDWLIKRQSFEMSQLRGCCFKPNDEIRRLERVIEGKEAAIKAKDEALQAAMMTADDNIEKLDIARRALKSLEAAIESKDRQLKMSSDDIDETEAKVTELERQASKQLDQMISSQEANAALRAAIKTKDEVLREILADPSFQSSAWANELCHVAGKALAGRTEMSKARNYDPANSANDEIRRLKAKIIELGVLAVDPELLKNGIAAIQEVQRLKAATKAKDEALQSIRQTLAVRIDGGRITACIQLAREAGREDGDD